MSTKLGQDHISAGLILGIILAVIKYRYNHHNFFEKKNEDLDFTKKVKYIEQGDPYRTEYTSSNDADGVNVNPEELKGNSGGVVETPISLES